jgi:competence protein ComEC
VEQALNTPSLARVRVDVALATWLVAERGRFVLFLPVFMAGGVVAYFARLSEPPLWPGLVVAVTALLAAAVARRPPVTRAILLGVGLAAAGFASAGIATWRAAPWVQVPRGAVQIVGRVAQMESLPEGRRVTIAVPVLDGGAPMARQVRVRLRSTDLTVLRPGDVVRVRALLRPPAPPSYPGGWDMQRDAFFHGMAAYGFALGAAERLVPAREGAWQALRETIAARTMAALPGAPGAVAATLLTGLGAAIPAGDRAAFQASGLAHLLAVAGLHIGIVMGLVFAVVRAGLAISERAALCWPVKRIAAVAALTAGLLYLALTGGHVPILRSFAMACLVTLGELSGRRAISVRALALAAVALMVFAPAEVMGVSFQMSFSAVLALVAGWEAMSPRLALMGAGKWWRSPALYVGGLALTSALAGTASLPFAAYHFGNAALFYVPANVVAVPITALWVMPWGLLALALMTVGLERLALAPMGWGVQGLMAIAHSVAGWPDATAPVPHIPAFGLLLVALGIAFLCIWCTRVRLAGLVPLVVGLASPWLAPSPDIVIAPDARVIAARVAGTVFARVASGASGFELQDPQRVWGVRASSTFPADGTAAGGAVSCAEGACRLRFGAFTAVLLTDPAANCAGAALAVSAAPLRGRCAPAQAVDRFSVLHDGATAVYFGPAGPVLLTDRDLRGARPWVIAPGPSAAARSKLPAATSE